MKFILLGIIQLYWKIIPEFKRRPCIFAENCSHYVYRITLQKGLYRGFLALSERFHKCRSGYTVFKDEQNNSFELCLKDGSIVKDDKISPTLLPPYNYNYKTKDKTLFR